VKTWNSYGPRNSVVLLRATMSLHRFEAIMVSARFDDKATRNERREFDKLAPIREMFDARVRKCGDLYICIIIICAHIDESLLSFRGRCSSRVYMPSKTARYGLNVCMLCDCGTSYATNNMQVYLGKARDGIQEKNQGARVVKDLCEQIHGSGRNIMSDNFFTGYDLAQFLLHKTLTLLCTVRKSRTELPEKLYQGSVLNMSQFLHSLVIHCATQESYCGFHVN